jgi:hypothetical protein
MWEAQIRKTKKKKKLLVSNSVKNLSVIMYAGHSSNGRKHKIGELWSRVSGAKSETLSPK